MSNIDCLFIGHYELAISKQILLSDITYGKNSHHYRDVLNLRYILINNKHYTVSEVYNLLKNDLNHVSFEEDKFSCAVGHLGSYLHKKGYNIDFINSFNDQKDELKNKLEKNKILTIAIPTTFYGSMFPIIEIINFIKKYNNSAKIILGGPFIEKQISSLRSDEPLQKFLSKINADVYVYSLEGEYALSQVVKAFKNSLSLDNVKNIYYKKNDKYIFTAIEKEENDINKEIVDWTIFKEGLRKHVNIRTALSCPFSCAFCRIPLCEGKYRMANVETIEKELDSLYKTGIIKNLFFIDDTLNYPIERFKKILRMMIKNNYNFKWVANFRCQYVDEEMAELMKESGCQLVLCGIESGSQTILNNMNKKATIEKYKEGMKNLHKYGILTSALIIIGFPGETYETYQETCNFLEDVKPTFYRTHRWYYDEYTPIHKDREKYSLEGDGFIWKHSTMDSETAFKLADEMFINIENSIHTADYSVGFDLLNYGMSVIQMKDFLKTFNQAVKERILQKNKETRNELIEKMKNIVNSCTSELLK